MNYFSKNILSVIAISMMGIFSAQTIETSYDLTQEGAIKLAQNANMEAKKLNKNVSVAVLNSSGVTLILLKGDHVGPHNTEASRRKAFTSVSTKTPSYILMKNAAESTDAKNLNAMPELLLLGGGVPVFDHGNLIGSLGVSGGGGSENDHNIAVKAVQDLGYSIEKGVK